MLENSTHGVPQEEDGSKTEPFVSPMTGGCIFCDSIDSDMDDITDVNAEVMRSKKTELSEVIAKQKEVIEIKVQSKLKLKFTELLHRLNIQT